MEKTNEDKPALVLDSDASTYTKTTPRMNSRTRDGPRVMLYSHDTFGLGHTERTVSIAGAVLERNSEANVLYVTGSPMIQNLKLPGRMDYVKLPSVVKIGAEKYAARYLDFGFGELLRLRSQLVKAVAEEFHPDVLLVDHAPVGMSGEILPTLETLRKTGRTRIVLGMRDVLDDPVSVSKVWQEQRIIEVLRKFYDLILVYGMKEFFNPVSEYGMPQDLRKKTFFTGYVYRPRPVRSTDQVREQFNIHKEPIVLVTVGGGEDARNALILVKEALSSRRLSGFSALITTGPMCPDVVKQSLSELTTDSRVHIIDFVDDLPTMIAASSLVLSMGGYNSISEVLAYGRRGIVLPRTEPRREQLIRATFLENLGFVTSINPSKYSPLALRELIEANLSDRSEPISERRHLVKLDGGRNAADLILALATSQKDEDGVTGSSEMMEQMRLHFPSQSKGDEDDPLSVVSVEARRQ